MKKIINGKKYDTETAKEIYGFSSGSDFGYISKILYRKKTGEFFICGEGGAMTSYAKVCEDGSICGSSEITPISEKIAKEFVEEYGSVEEYEQVFGEVEE